MGFTYIDVNVFSIDYMEWSDSDSADAARTGSDCRCAQRRIDALTALNTDTIVHHLQFQLVDPGDSNLDWFTVTVPIGAGLTAPLYDAIPATLQAKAGGIVIPRDWNIRCLLRETISSGKEVRVIIQGGTK